MGWWNADSQGNSFSGDEGGLWWGDSVADIIDGALEKIDEEFMREFGRQATGAELISGLRFSSAIDRPQGEEFVRGKAADEFEDKIASARAAFDQTSRYSDEVTEWLGKRHTKMAEAGLPEDVRMMLLGRLIDAVMPASNPLEDMMRIMVERAEQALREEEGDEA